MSVGDGVGGTSLNAVAAEDAAVVVDVVDLGVALGTGDALLGSLDIDAVRWARSRAEITGDAFFQPVLIALQNVRAAVALLQHGTARRAGAVRVVLNLGGLEDLPEGDAHSFADSRDVAHDRHGISIRDFAFSETRLSAPLYYGVDALRRF